ncbi:MAG TPA: tetratricopeptide repeat protein, partial [bacterium]|nr:tetratricopeptide repeat protein [bacterium]
MAFLRKAAWALAAALLISAAAAAQEAGDVGDLLFRGQKSLAAQEWRDAAALFEQALAVDADNADALRGLAEAYEGAGDLREAVKYYDRLQLAAGKSLEVSYKIGFLAEKLGDRARTVTAYEDVVGADPNHLKAWRALADLYGAGNDYKNQAKALEALVARTGETADRLELAALYETKLGRTGDAVAEYERILRAEPRDEEAHSRLAAIFFGRGDYVRAAEHYEELTRINPDDADAFWKLAQARLALEDDFGATKALERVTSLRPRDSAALVLLGTLYNRAEDYSRAERTLEDAVDAGAGDAEAYCQLGIAQFGLKANARARSSFEKALARDDKHRLALEHFSELLYREGEYARAWEYADRLVTLARDNVRAHLYRGLAAAATERYEAAEESLEKVIKAEPSNVEARVGLG